MKIHHILTSPRLCTTLALAALLSLAVGVWGAWLAHPAAGLVILGIDLPEYVKFLPQTQSGAIALQRETFFLPLIALIAALILLGSWRQGPFPLLLRITFLFLALPATFAMLPPAWTPYLLRQPEFHKQMVIMGLLITADLLAPLWVLIPIQLRGMLFLGLALLPLKPLLAYTNIRPALESLYREPITYGPGFFSSILGMFLLASLGLSLILAHSRRNSKKAGLST